MSATLRVTREAKFGFELRSGTFDISLDGETVRSIEWGKTVEVPVEPGQHALPIRKRRYSSLGVSGAGWRDDQLPAPQRDALAALGSVLRDT